MAITILDVQQATHNSSSNTLALPAFAVDPSNGDTIIVAYASWSLPGNTLAPTDSAGNTYVQIGTEVTHSKPEIVSLWYAHNVVGGSSFVVTGHLTSNNHHTAIAWLLSGDYAYNGDFTNAGGNGTNPLSTGTSSPAPSGEAFFLGVMSYGTGTAATDASGWNDTASHGFSATLQGRSRLTSFTTVDLYTEYKVATATAQAATWGISGTQDYNCLVASFSSTGLVVALTGLAATASGGTFTSADRSVSLTGIAATTAQGSVGGADKTVGITGLSMTSHIGSVANGAFFGVASIIYRQAVSATSAGLAASVTTDPITTGNTNLLVVQVACATRTISGTPLTDNYSNTWVQSWARAAASGTASPTALYYASNCVGGAGHTFTFTPQGGTDQCVIAVAEFSGVSPTTPLDQVSTAKSSGQPHVSGDVTTTSPTTQLLIGSAGVGNGNCDPPASSPGLFIDAVSLPSQGVILSYAIVAATGAYEYQYSYENGSADSEGTGLATFKGTAIAFVQSKSAQSNAAVSLAAPSIASVSGHFLAVIVSSGTRTFSGSPISDTYGNAWALAWATSKTACYYALNIVGGAGHVVTVTPPGGSSACAIAVAEFSGIDAASALDQVVSATTTTEPRSSGVTARTAQNAELLIGGGSTSHLTTYPYSVVNGDWTDVAAIHHQTGGPGAQMGIILSYRIATLAGTYGYGFSAGFPAVDEHVGIATFKSVVPIIPIGGVVPAAVDPADDTSICGAEVPLFYCELQKDSGFNSYSWVDQPINEPTIQRLPRIVAMSKLRRELSDWNGRLVINGGSVTLTDYDGDIRAMIRANTIVRKQIDFYMIDQVNLPPTGLSPEPVPFRCGQYLITQYKLGNDMTVRLDFEDRFGGDSLKDVLYKPLPYRTLSTAVNSTLPTALNGKGEPITYGSLSDEVIGFPTVQVWFIGDYTMPDASSWYEGLIAGCATSGPISVWGWDGLHKDSDGNPKQLRLDPSYYDTDIAMPGLGANWATFFGATKYRVKNGRRYTLMYFRAGSDIGEAFKLFATSNGSQGVPFQVNMGGIEDTGDSTGAVIESLAYQWQHLITNYVESEVRDANWSAIPLTANTVPYSIIDTASVEATKDVAANTRVPGGYNGAFVIGHDLSRLPLGDWFQRLCLGGDMDMGIDRHGRMFLSMEDPTDPPVMNFTITSVLQDTYQPPEKDQSKLYNSVQSNTIKNLFQVNSSVTLRPSADQTVGANPMWLTAGHPPAEDADSISRLGGDPMGRKEQLFDDWVTRDFTLNIPESVKAHRLARSKDGPDFHAHETDLCGLEQPLGKNFTMTHFAGLTPTTRTVRCTAIELEPPDPIRRSWAVRLFGYDVSGLRAPSPTPLYSVSVIEGTVDGLTTGSFLANTVVSLLANAPAAGQVFDHWDGGSGLADRLAAATLLTMPSADIVLAAQYRADATLFSLIVVGGSGSGNFASGSTQTIVANAPASGYTFYQWTGATVASSSASTTTLTMPSATTTVTATYSWEGILVEWDANPSGDGVLGYLVDWGTSPGVYTNSRDVGDVLTYRLMGLVGGTTYYIAIRAYNSSPFYSPDSTEVSDVSSVHLP